MSGRAEDMLQPVMVALVCESKIQCTNFFLKLFFGS